MAGVGLQLYLKLSPLRIPQSPKMAPDQKQTKKQDHGIVAPFVLHTLPISCVAAMILIVLLDLWIPCGRLLTVFRGWLHSLPTGNDAAYCLHLHSRWGARAVRSARALRAKHTSLRCQLLCASAVFRQDGPGPQETYFW